MPIKESKYKDGLYYQLLYFMAVMLQAMSSCPDTFFYIGPGLWNFSQRANNKHYK